MSDTSSTAAAAPRTPVPWRRIAAVGAVWLAVVAAVIGVAAALDRPPADAADQPLPAELPPLSLYLNRPLPPEIAKLPTIAEQAKRLQAIANSTNDAARWVDLGAFAQRLEARGDAQLAFRRALLSDPNSLEARVGLLMVDGGTGTAGLERAGRALADLEAANPDSQLVVFNRAMIAVYRSDRATFDRGFARTIRLGATTELGRLAARFAGVAGGP